MISASHVTIFWKQQVWSPSIVKRLYCKIFLIFFYFFYFFFGGGGWSGGVSKEFFLSWPDKSLTDH